MTMVPHIPKKGSLWKADCYQIALRSLLLGAKLHIELNALQVKISSDHLDGTLQVGHDPRDFKEEELNWRMREGGECCCYGLKQFHNYLIVNDEVDANTLH